MRFQNEVKKMIKRHTKNYIECGTPNNLARPGRPPKLSPSEKKHWKLSSLREKRKALSVYLPNTYQIMSIILNKKIPNYEYNLFFFLFKILV